MGILTGKTALITGAARGIGKAIAMRFAQEGANIAFTDLVIDEEHGGKETERELAALGVQAKGYAGNAADFESTAALVSQIKEEFGSIDILVNNAGITKDGLMLRMTEAQCVNAKVLSSTWLPWWVFMAMPVRLITPHQRRE